MISADFDNKLKDLNKKRSSNNKIKHVETKKEPTDLTKKVAKILDRGYGFLLGRIYFTGDDGYRNFQLQSGYHPEYYLKKLNHLILIFN